MSQPLDTPQQIQGKIASLKRDLELRLKRADIEQSYMRAESVSFTGVQNAKDRAMSHTDACETLSYLIECLEMGDIAAYREATL